MKLLILITVFVTTAIAQGYFPPGLQYNPFFNPQNPNPYFPSRNLTGYNPYFNQYRPQNNSNGFGFFNYWNNFPYRIPFSSNSPRSLTGRIGGYPYYQPYNCIPDYHQCNGSHSLNIGCLTQWDRVLFRQSYVKPGRWYSRRQKSINYPGDFLPPGYVCNTTITAIRIQDRYCNGTGGYAQIIPGSGGVGNCKVSIKLFSTGTGKGFSFYVQIFGR